MENTKWTAEELLTYGRKMSARKGFRGDALEDAAQAFAIGAWEAQEKADPDREGFRGYVTRGGLNGLKSYIRMQAKHSRIEKKKTDTETGDFDYEEIKILSGDYNGEDGEGCLSFWESVADETATNPLDAMEDTDNKNRLASALQCLTGREKEMLLAYYCEGKTYREIAETLPISHEMVRKIVKQATDRMKMVAA
jgi:RNA polymerase sigma factor (sigma-70 family)